jgi:hypothetical protein
MLSSEPMQGPRRSAAPVALRSRRLDVAGCAPRAWWFPEALGVEGLGSRSCRGTCLAAVARDPALFLPASSLACCVAGVALGLLLGFERGLFCRGFFLLPRDPRCLKRRRFFLSAFFLKSRAFAGGLGVRPFRCDRLSLGASPEHLGIVSARLSAEFVEEILL